MTELQKVLVVFDPTREEQPALERAVTVAGETDLKLHVIACIYSDLGKSADKVEETRQLLDAQRETLENVVAPLRKRGIDVATEVEWDKDWYHAVVRASVRVHADMVFKSSYRHSAGKRLLNRTSDFTLIRECHCPVLLIKEQLPGDARKVLAAIDIRVKTESYEKLNEHIIDFSRRLLESDRTEVHFVNAFEDFRALPDRQALVEKSGIDSDRIHIKMGSPDRVIVDTAKKLDANLVVVGNSGRSGLAAVFHGNTVEKVLDKLDCNVLSMP